MTMDNPIKKMPSQEKDDSPKELIATPTLITVTEAMSILFGSFSPRAKLRHMTVIIVTPFSIYGCSKQTREGQMRAGTVFSTHLNVGDAEVQIGRLASDER